MIPADFWKRVAAHLVDGLIVNLMTLPLLLLVFPRITSLIAMQNEALNQQGLQTLPHFQALYYQHLMLPFILPTLLISVLYYAYQESSRYQATLGKRLVGIRVVDMHDRPLTFLRAVARTLAKQLSAMTFGIGFLMALFTRRKQALHDLIAGTRVVETRHKHVVTNPASEKSLQNGNDTFVG